MALENCPLCNGIHQNIFDHLCASWRNGGHSRQPEEAKKIIEQFDGNVLKKRSYEPSIDPAKPYTRPPADQCVKHGRPYCHVCQEAKRVGASGDGHIYLDFGFGADALMYGKADVN